MRVLLSTYGSRGDVEPMVGLAVQLRALGAEVRVCAPPDEEFAKLLAGVSVPLVPFRRPWRSWERPATAEERTQRVAEFIAAQYDTVAAAAEGCDVLLATAMSHFVAQSAAEKVDIPHRYVIFAPNVLTDLDVQNWNALFGPPINSHRASIDLPPVDDVRAFMFTDHPWLAADPTLSPWPKSADLDVMPTGAWILPDVRPLPAGLVAFLDAGTPPVYVGFGSMRGVPEDIAQVSIAAIRALGRRVLLARGWADLAPVDSGDDCFAVGEVNQQALFGRVTAVVHHGGAGTTTTAARAGVPQVVVPQAGGDQPYWAGRVAELGIGAAHDGPAPTTESLAAALRTALSGETRARATRIAGTISADGATVAARLLIEAVTLDTSHVSA
ncbi:glycosyl transferase [Parafrankia soli]|uniref:Glycosyl transferase n=1 Tax=Parafrankia soli TaxID=2599596 RepID=A0A1S1RAU7_9ACTN|nr:glycosyltransferase [Parafrankia soli]OHV43107.1 glycosyl transferase [Parafrankia soli]